MTTRSFIVLIMLQTTTKKCFSDFNLIESIKANVTTSQSSIYSPSNNPQDFNSSKAIDGVHNYSMDTCKCCSVSDGDPPSWWQIDLKQRYLIGSLQIFGRAANYNYQLENATIYAGNVSIKTNMTLVYKVPSMTTSTQNFTNKLDGIIAQYFRVELNQKVLTLCEFKLFGKECDIGYFGSGCLHSCHCSDNNKCDQVTGKCQTPGCLAGWTGEACEYDLNLIERIRANVVTSQSSTYAPSQNPYDFNSSKAIDGAHNYSVDTCKCCSVTDGHPPSWWQIDLKQRYLIGAIQIFGRTADYPEQLEHAVIYASNESMGPNMSKNKMKVYEVPDITDTQVFTKELDPLIAQYVLVELSQKILVLCEFKLYEKECKVGYFGSGCLHMCQCSDNSKCDQVSGKCQTPGCLTGWKGEACTDVCNHGDFGIGCNKMCHCKDNTSCDHISGHCDTELCDPGWLLPTCSQEQNILRRLDVQTDMSSTFLNWTSTLAIDGNIGPKPDVCNCCSGTKNSPISWWTVDMGKRYPINSVTVFSRDYDQLYQQLADFELYLANDTGQNSFHLVENSTRRIDGNKHVLTFSNKLTRFIKIQRPGVLTLCEVMVFEGECQVGTFGEECSEICHCADDLACDKTNGYCQSDACKSGWIGKSCNQECPKNKFGDRCSETCFCAEGTCTSNYGVCQNGCQQGYTGFHCNQVGDFNNHTRPANEEKNSAALIAVVIGVSIAGLIICVLVGVVVLKVRRKSSEGNKSHYSTPNSPANQGDQDYDTLDILNDNQGRRNTTYQNEVVSNM